jgi:hypothetical protein
MARGKNRRQHVQQADTPAATSLIDVLRKDVSDSVSLYFAPVFAVVGEFSRAVGRASHAPGQNSPKKGGTKRAA